MSSIFKFLANLDRKLIHGITFVLVTLLLLYPVGIPIVVSSETQVSYNLIDQLKPGDIVMINYDVAAYGWDELKGQCLAVTYHVFEKPGVKVIFTADIDQGVQFIEETFRVLGKPMAGKTGAPWYELNGKKYLEDYINLGYFPGASSAWAAMANDFAKGAGTSDWYKNDVSAWYQQIGIKTGADVDLAISFDCLSGADLFRNQFYPLFKTKIIAGEIGVNVPPAINNYNAGLYAGILKSSPGGAEYQFLGRYKGKALISMDAYSAVHMYLVLLIVLGNIGYFGWEKGNKEVKK